MVQIPSVGHCYLKASRSSCLYSFETTAAEQYSGIAEHGDLFSLLTRLIRGYTLWPPLCWWLAPQLSAPPTVHPSVLPALLKKPAQGIPAPSPALQPGPHLLQLAYSAFLSSAARSIPRSHNELAGAAGSHPRAPCTWQAKTRSVQQHRTPQIQHCGTDGYIGYLNLGCPEGHLNWCFLCRWTVRLLPLVKHLSHTWHL